MTHYPCDVCSIERCGGCCYQCRRSSELCVCAERLQESLKAYQDWQLEAELDRRHEARNQTKLKTLKDERSKLDKQIKGLEKKRPRRAT